MDAINFFQAQSPFTTITKTFGLKKIAIIGGGPAGLFMYNRLIEMSPLSYTIDIFEATAIPGNGMPYSYAGANPEHVTNVSGNEIPWLMLSLKEWVEVVSETTLQKYAVDRTAFHDYKVIPRLLFGEYLGDQFYLLKKQADASGLSTTIHINSAATDMKDDPVSEKVLVEINHSTIHAFDHVIICTGHHWPLTHEGSLPGYFDSPYPPSKLKQAMNHPVAIKGSSLTAIDAIRTIARSNGQFARKENNQLEYIPDKRSPQFSINMHSRHGLLPAIRFHLEDPRLKGQFLLTKDQLEEHRANNDGFLSLDYIFEKNFKDSFIGRDDLFYGFIKKLTLEEFVQTIMSMWERQDAFELFAKEFNRAAESIRLKQSIYWKESLAVLSFAINYPAKYFSAEDMLRLQKILKPLIAVVIAFVPQDSAEELLALLAAGKLSVTATGDNAEIVPDRNGIIYSFTNDKGKDSRTVYKTFIDCTGQPALGLNDFPFKSLLTEEVITQATLPFRSASAGEELHVVNKFVGSTGSGYYLEVPGLAINDHFQVLNKAGVANERIFIMAVPYIAGYNPDYSGLDFCEAASALVAEALVKN